jgi:hypothetical protein
MPCPGCCSCGVLRSSAVLFRMRVVLVFRDIIYVINILYSWHLVICEHFFRMCGTIDPVHTYDEYLILLTKLGMTPSTLLWTTTIGELLTAHCPKSGSPSRGLASQSQPHRPPATDRPKSTGEPQPGKGAEFPYFLLRPRVERSKWAGPLLSRLGRVPIEAAHSNSAISYFSVGLIQIQFKSSLNF